MKEYESVLWDRKIFSSFPPEEIKKLRNFFKILPFSSHCILEFPTSNYHVIDFSINIKSQDTLRNYFNSVYADNYSILYDAKEFIADVWIEYDSLKQNYLSSHFFSIKNFNHYDIENVNRFFQTIFPALSPHCKEQIRNIFSVIPKDNVISHVGFMQNRSYSPVRLNIKMAENNIRHLLDILHLVIPNSDVWDLIKCADSLTLTIDNTSEGISSRFGLECFFNSQERDNPSFLEFFSKLIEYGYAKSELVDYCTDWIGIEKSAETSSIASKLLRNIKSPYFWRIINHFKIVVEPDRTQVKIYLGFGHKWI